MLDVKHEVRVDLGFQALIPTLHPAERNELERSIERDGCRDALVVWRGTILDGHNRYEICDRLGIPFKTVGVELPDRRAAQEWIIRNQFSRRNLTTFQRLELALKLEPLIAQDAKKKQRESGGPVPQKSAKPPVETRAVLAKIAGVSHDTVHKARVIAAKAPEPVKEKLRRGQVTINAAYKRIVEAESKAQQLKQIRTAKQPVGQFRVIVADPAWPYEKRTGDPTHRGSVPYPSMTLQEIANYPVAKLALDNSMLWLWTTNAFMQEACEVAEVWGFKVKTILTWAKPHMGAGIWLRGQTEHCLFAVRGRPLVTLTNQTTVIHAATREHSRKPDEFYSLVESLCPGSRCELFGRYRREGWTTFGTGMRASRAKIARARMTEIEV